jgi:cytochrome c-type biogenesis protein
MEAGSNLSLFIAFTAGLFTFISPCVLPLIPSYLSFITGISFEQLNTAEDSKKLRRVTIFHSLMFILGFSIVFILLGASATFLGGFLRQYQNLIAKIGGALIILFGLHISGLLKIKFLQKEKRMHLRDKPLGYFGSAMVGLTFAAGWTPCIGPILGTILVFAGTTANLYRGIFLLVSYSLGLAIPFFLTSLAVNSALPYFKKLTAHLRIISIISGVFLIVIGILLITGYFNRLGMYLSSILPS